MICDRASPGFGAGNLQDESRRPCEPRSLPAWRRAHGLIQRFLSRDLRGNGLLQAPRGGAAAGSRRAKGCPLQPHARRSGLTFRHHSIRLGSRVSHFVAAGSGAAGGKLESELARLTRVPCCRTTGLSACLAPFAEQFRHAWELMRSIVIERGGAAAVEVMRPAGTLAGLKAVLVSTAMSWPRASTSCFSSRNLLLQPIGRSLFRSLTSRSTSVSAVGPDAIVRTRRARAVYRSGKSARTGWNAARPPWLPSRCLRMISSYSRSSSPELRRSGNLVVDEVCRHHRPHEAPPRFVALLRRRSAIANATEPWCLNGRCCAALFPEPPASG
jgi:hypothetical protein